MKEKRTIIKIASLVLSCHLVLTACQTKNAQSTEIEKPKTTVKSSKATKKVEKKTEKSTKKKDEKKSGVPGVDVPTSDGFLFTDEKKIIARTDEGIVVDHDGHSHFIFFKDLKNSKWAYLIPEKSMASTNHHGQNTQVVAHGNLVLDDGYVFNPKDIVSEDANGYTVRHGDHFHYIWKSSLSTPQALSVVTDNRTHHQAPAPQYIPSNHQQGIPGIDFPTSDGFLFDGTNIRGYTRLGILVGHGHHDHLIPYDQLAASKWAHLVPKNIDSASTPKTNIPDSTKPSDTDSATKLLAEKKAYLAQELHVSEESIELIDTPEGQAFVYPHGDHRHSVLVSLVEIGKPIEDPHADPHAHDKVGMATLKEMGFDEDIIHDILHASADTPFPSNEKDPAKMKEWLLTVKALNIGQRTNPLGRFGLHLMPNIEVLGAGFTPIHDIKPVLQFQKLKQLWLTDTGVTDYSFIKSLPNLEGLDLSQNGVKDLNFLKEYKNMKVLAFAGNQLSDISVLAELPHLQSLNMDNNNLTDISALKNLQYLQALSMENNDVRDLTALSGKNELARLFISNNPNADMSTLKTEKLEELTAKQNNIKNLEFIENNPALKTLDLAENNLTDLKGIEKAEHIETLDASKNKISTLEIEGKQSSLKTLNVSENDLKNLDGVNSYQELERINASSNELETLELKEKNESLTYLDVSKNHIPESELTPNAQNIPQEIADNFAKVDSGDISGNKPAEVAKEKVAEANSETVSE